MIATKITVSHQLTNNDFCVLLQQKRLKTFFLGIAVAKQTVTALHTSSVLFSVETFAAVVGAGAEAGAEAGTETGAEAADEAGAGAGAEARSAGAKVGANIGVETRTEACFESSAEAGSRVGGTVYFGAKRGNSASSSRRVGGMEFRERSCFKSAIYAVPREMIILYYFSALPALCHFYPCIYCMYTVTHYFTTN